MNWTLSVLDLANKHLIHVECSLDALQAQKREQKFAAKFERGRRYITQVFNGIELPDDLDQVVLLQFASGRIQRKIGGGRLVTVREFINEVFDGLKSRSPSSGAVPSTLPLLRTVQLAADARRGSLTINRLVPQRNVAAASGADAQRTRTEL